MLITRIFEITFPIFSIVALGFFFARRFKPDMQVANWINMDVFVPALMFSVIVGKSVDVRAYSDLILSGAIIVLGSGLIMWPIARWLKIETKTIVPPMMFSNAGNMGLPLIALAFGEQALPAAVILFIVENILHFTLGTSLLSGHGNILKPLYSPLVLVTAIALLIGATDLTVPSSILLPITMLGDISIPLMLFSLGVRLADANIDEWKIGLIGAVFSPVTGILLALGAMFFIDLSPSEQGILFLFGALPPAVLNFMFSERYQQEPSKVASIVIIGNAFSFISIPLTLTYVLPRFT